VNLIFEHHWVKWKIFTNSKCHKCSVVQKMLSEMMPRYTVSTSSPRSPDWRFLFKCIWCLNITESSERFSRTPSVTSAV
jgi:hypothetical protein